jgi:hypothetical protein
MAEVHDAFAGRSAEWRSGYEAGIAAMQSEMEGLQKQGLIIQPAEVERLRTVQIKHMVDRFLCWRLPENFNPDAGISFKQTYNEHTAHPMKYEPVGTNLFDATQADAMVRYMIEGMPGSR